MQRRFWWWPAALILGAVGIWSIIDPLTFKQWQGLVLLALFPVGVWLIWRGVKRRDS